MKKVVVLIVAVIWTSASSGQKKTLFTTDDYVRALKHATDIMVNDVTSPVAASRYYAYITLTGYETFRQFDRRLQPFSFFLKGFSDISVEDSLIRKSYVQLATIVALYKSASRLLPSGKLLLKNVDSLRAVALQRKLSVEKINSTFRLVDRVVEQVIKYAYADGFVKLSGLRRFTPTAGDAYWNQQPLVLWRLLNPTGIHCAHSFLIPAHNLQGMVRINIVRTQVHYSLGR